MRESPRSVRLGLALEGPAGPAVWKLRERLDLGCVLLQERCVVRALVFQPLWNDWLLLLAQASLLALSRLCYYELFNWHFCQCPE